MLLQLACYQLFFLSFFASLAVILAFPDNEFITFIEEPYKIFSRLLYYFKITLFGLFISLLYTIIVYIVSSAKKGLDLSTKPLFCIFIFLFAYSLIATALSVAVTLKLTSQRATYIVQKKQNENEDKLMVEETPEV